MALTIKVWPAGAASVAMVSDGAAAAWAYAAYVQIVAAATIDAPSWISGVFLNVPVVETHYADIAIATGGAGAEVDAFLVPYGAGLPAATALTTWVPVSFPYALPTPIYVATAARLAGRLRKNTAASAAGAGCKVMALSGTGP